MLLHIGNGKTVHAEEIIGIFDLDNATLSRESRTYLSIATRRGEVSYADSDIPRSFLVMGKKKRKIKKSTGVDTLHPSKQNKPTLFREENKPRPRHPARRGGIKTEPPAQTVLLSHISSAALHARCERPLFEEE